MRTESRLRLISIPVSISLILGTGCVTSKHHVTTITETTEEYISVDTLANRLGMDVATRTERMAVLRNSANQITLFPGPNSLMYVNGEPLGERGAVIRERGKLWVSASREPSLRAMLTPIVAKPSPPPPPPPPRRLKAVIVIDAGHGGKDPGTRGVSRLREKTIVLSIASNLATMLRQRGARVIMTRSGDRYVELDDRAAVADRNRADLLLSIHADSAPRKGASGVTFYAARAASTESIQIARRLNGVFIRAGFESRGVKRADFRVLVAHSRPSVLFEAGYMTNPGDARRLSSPAHQKLIAGTLAEALMEIYGQ